MCRLCARSSSQCSQRGRCCTRHFVAQAPWLLRLLLLSACCRRLRRSMLLAVRLRL
jgi:hypothetical protein